MGKETPESGPQHIGIREILGNEDMLREIGLPLIRRALSSGNSLQLEEEVERLRGLDLNFTEGQLRIHAAINLGRELSESDKAAKAKEPKEKGMKPPNSSTVVHLPNGSVRRVSQAVLGRCQEADRLRKAGLNNRQIGESLGVSRKTAVGYLRIIKAAGGDKIFEKS